MDIIVSVNDKFVVPLLVLLKSIKINSQKEELNVHLLYSSKNLRKENVNYLKHNVARQGINLLMHEIDESLFMQAPLNKYWSIETYFRVLSFVILKDIQKALWLDADIIVQKDISEFYNQKIDKYYACVCRETTQTHTQRLELDASHVFFNAGVILFNLERIRKRYSLSDVIKILNERSEELLLQDEDILNIMFANEVTYADENVYNHQIYGFNPVSLYERKKAENASILHFSGPFKPWKVDYLAANWLDDLWWRYACENDFRMWYKYLLYRLAMYPNKVYFTLREYSFIFYAVLRKMTVFFRGNNIK